MRWGGFKARRLGVGVYKGNRSPSRGIEWCAIDICDPFLQEIVLYSNKRSIHAYWQMDSRVHTSPECHSDGECVDIYSVNEFE